ncbi:hypothetical protein KR044_001565, partial [Drosophila immigrans]
NTMDDAWWHNQLEQLPNKRLDTLNTLSAQLAANPPKPPILKVLLQSQALYDCVGGKEVSDLAIEFVRECVNLLSPPVHDERFVPLLELAAKHPHSAIRQIVYDHVLQKLQSHPEMPLPNSQLLLLVLGELQQKETQLTGIVMRILSEQLLLWLTDKDVVQLLVQLMQQGEVICCRVYELAVVLAIKSPAALEAVEFILDAALTELLGDDVLVMCSVMEILVPLAEQNHGLSYMERRHVLETISKHVEPSENVLNQLLLPNIMKFFGKIAAVQPQKVIEGYPSMLHSLCELLLSGEENGDGNMLPVAMETLANLMSSSQGKTLMQSTLASTLPKVFAKYGDYLNNLSPPLKIRLLESLDVIYTTDNRASNEMITQMAGWYEIIAGGQQIDHLMKLLNTPFADLQVAALGFLLTICKYGWGIKAVQQTAGAIEFLLSRQQQLDNDVKFHKWKVMEMLSVSDGFSPSEIVRFTAYVKEGPYYVPTQVNIATEGSN